jgi:hypothetical protein
MVITFLLALVLLVLQIKIVKNKHWDKSFMMLFDFYISKNSDENFKI